MATMMSRSSKMGEIKKIVMMARVINANAIDGDDSNAAYGFDETDQWKYEVQQQ
jgi:hypothetical protein